MDELPYNPEKIISPSVNKPAIKMALMISGMLIVYTLVIYLANQGTNRYLGWGNYLLIIIGLTLATNNFRNTELGGYITFGKAFHLSFMICLYTSLIFGAYMYIHLKFIAHDMIHQMVQMSEDALMNQKIPEDQKAMAINMYKKYIFIPGTMTILTAVVTLFMGTILSLFNALITRRDPPPVLPEP